MDSLPEECEEVRELFRERVPEVADGIVRIKGVARVRGERTIVAVCSTDIRVDPVASCFGERGCRVKAMVQHLSGEKIDIVHWSDSTEDYTRNLLAPAQLRRVVLDENVHRITIYADACWKSLIVGRRGTRLELVRRILGWDLQMVDL